MLGETIGLAVCSALLRSHVCSSTAGLELTEEQASATSKAPEALGAVPFEDFILVRQAYADVYTRQMRAMLYFCVAAMVSLLFLAEKHPRRLQTREGGELAAPVWLMLSRCGFIWLRDGYIGIIQVRHK